MVDKEQENADKETELQKASLAEPETNSVQPPKDQPFSGGIPSPVTPSLPPAKKHWFKRLWATKRGKALVMVIALLVVAGVLLAIPQTRYGILGNVIKKNVSITITDSLTGKPVSQADAWLGTTHAFTDSKGIASFDNTPANIYTLKISKKYYKDTSLSYTVPVFSAAQNQTIQLEATGRQVNVSVTNKITHGALAKATLTVGDTSSETDDKGTATLVLPADKKTFQGWIRLDGYNTADITVDESGSNTFSLTPAGNVFYLSKQTGTINVMKSNLDGTNASVVVQGTGNELDDSTVLLAARDWKYLALSAKRDPAQVSQLYLVNAQSGALTTIDEGDASFQLVGWSDHKFTYLVTRNHKNAWDDKQQSIKSYDADTGKTTILDETTGSGTNNYDFQTENIQNLYILNNKIVYAKNWSEGSNYTYSGTTDKKPAIMVVNPDGSNKQRVKEFSMQHYAVIEAKLYEPQGIYFHVSIDNGITSNYEFEDGAVKNTTLDDSKFYDTVYPTYLVSPSSQKTFWSDSRDGKNTLLVGDQDAKNSKTLASQSDFTAYGWYTDQYTLLSKNGSELYIASANDSFDAVQPIKVTNYHKPQISFPGYGYGYGGNG